MQIRDSEAFREFKQGLTLLRDEYPAEALPHISRAVELEKDNPFYLSYLGLLLGVVKGKWAEAEQYCDAALRMKRNQAQLYLNLAEVYLKAGRKGDAVDVLTMGQKYTGRDVRLARALRILGVRRPPVLSFLQRRNFLNRQLGRLRQRVLQLFGTA